MVILISSATSTHLGLRYTVAAAGVSTSFGWAAVVRFGCCKATIRPRLLLIAFVSLFLGSLALLLLRHDGLLRNKARIEMTAETAMKETERQKQRKESLE